MRRLTDAPMWTQGAAEYGWRWYFGEDQDSDVSPYASPSRAIDLSSRLRT
jgi:hypothetical protein